MPMEPMTVRCPNCRKKQEEPYPQRCGCGQSLLTVLAARGHAADARRSGTAAMARRVAGRTRAAGAQATERTPFESGENDW